MARDPSLLPTACCAVPGLPSQSPILRTCRSTIPALVFRRAKGNFVATAFCYNGLHYEDIALL